MTKFRKPKLEVGQRIGIYFVVDPGESSVDAELRSCTVKCAICKQENVVSEKHLLYKAKTNKRCNLCRYDDPDPGWSKY